MIRAVLLVLCAIAFALLAYFFGGVLPIYGLPGYLTCAVAAVVALFLVRRLKIPPSQTCVIFGLVFGGYLMARAVVSPVPTLAVRDLFSIEASIILYVLIAFQLVETRQRLLLLGVMCLLLMVQTVIGVIQFTQGDNFMIQGIVRADYGIRASGFYVCPNHFAGFAEVIALLCFAVVIWGRMSYLKKILFGYCGCVGLIAVVLSGSRGGYLSIAAGGAALIALSLWLHVRFDKQKIGRFIFVVVLLTALTSVGAAWIISKSDTLKERAANIANMKNVRLSLWHSALQQNKESKLFGTGAGTFTYYGRKYRDPLRVQHDPVRVHNDYLELLAEYGLVGMILFLVCLGAHARNGIRALLWLIENRLIHSSRGQSSALALLGGSLAALVAIAVHSIVDFNMHIPANALVVAWLFGVLANPGVEMGVRASRREPVFLLAQGFAACLGLFLMFQLIPNARKEYYGEQARLALKRGDVMGALLEAKKAVPGNNASHYYILGEARRLIAWDAEDRIRDSFFKAAIEAYQQSLQLFPYDSMTMLRLGECYDALGKYKEAERAFEDAGRWDPNLARYHSMLGQHYQRMGRLEDAKREFQQALKLKSSLKYASAALVQVSDAIEGKEAPPTPSETPKEPK